MRLLIYILCALFLALAIGTQLSRDTGLLVFSYAGYNVQTSVSFFILAALLCFIAGYLLFRALGGLIRLPKNFKRWSRHRRHRRAEKYLGRGLQAILEEDWRSAEQAFQRGAAFSSRPLVNYLAAASAAQNIGAIERRDHYLRLAYDDGPDAPLAVGLTQARLQLSQGQTEQAYATLQSLVADGHGNQQVSALLLEAASALKEWPDALRILNQADGNRLLSADQLRERQQAVYAGLLREAAEQQDRGRLDREWEMVPRKLKEDTVLLEAYVDARRRFQGTEDCELLLRRALKKNYTANLARQYGLVDSTNIAKQIQFAERLLAGNPRDAILLLTLGRLCVRNSLWGKARTYLQDSLSARPSAEAYRELALLLEKQGDHAAASSCFHRGLALATGHYDADRPMLLESPGDARALADAARNSA